MIWEVDENLDGCVDWEEFKLMFRRNITDKSGLEPVQLFNVVQFMMYDKDFSGEVSVDETMHMLFSRYGKARLEAEMKALFGDSLSTDGDGTLTFADSTGGIETGRSWSKGMRDICLIPCSSANKVIVNRFCLKIARTARTRR